MDHATLSQKLATYLDDGPRWAAYDVDYEGKNVLVILVEPPREGDRIHALRKALDPAKEGTVYQRRTAQSEPANYQAMQMLQERLLGGVDADPEFNLDLDVEGETLWRVNWTDSAVESWLGRRRSHIDENTSKPPLGQLDQGRFTPFTYYQRPEDAAKFNEALDEHIRICRRQLRSEVANKIFNSRYNKIRFTVHNDPNRSVTGVKLIVKFPAVAVVIDSTPSTRAMPEPPTWPGPTGVIVNPAFMPVISSMGPSRPKRIPGPKTPRVERKEAGFEVIFALGDFAPGDSITTDPITVVAGAGTPEEIPIQLIGRAMSRSGQRVIDKTVTVGGNLWEIEDLVPVEPA